MGSILHYKGYTHSASDGSVSRDNNAKIITYGCVFHPKSTANFGGHIMNAQVDITGAEIIGIIKTIAFLWGQDAFRKTKMVHVHHVNNLEAAKWAAHIAHSIKAGGSSLDYVELTTKLHMTPEHADSAALFVMALRQKDIIFRQQTGHTPDDDKHVGSILNREADAQCNILKDEIIQRLKGPINRNSNAQIISKLERASILNARNKKLTKKISITTTNM
jgi:hypothetical protein